MLDQDQIDAMAESDAVLDRVQERMEAGAPLHRELKTDEIRPLIRAAIMWRRAAMNLWADKLQADLDSMAVGPAQRKYTEAGQ